VKNGIVDELWVLETLGTPTQENSPGFDTIQDRGARILGLPDIEVLRQSRTLDLSTLGASRRPSLRDFGRFLL
jgi:hypothetical protein